LAIKIQLKGPHEISENFRHIQTILFFFPPQTNVWAYTMDSSGCAQSFLEHSKEYLVSLIGRHSLDQFRSTRFRMNNVPYGIRYR
jgi:hypothetical protein